MDFNYVEIGLAVLTIVLGFLTTRYGDKIRKIRKVVVATDAALEDGKITSDEWAHIYKLVKDITK